ncbi:MAG: OmpA family protein [Candidatus Sumerlaeota bacterium]|nr:OmpA family protein [Candidatus Sumerlaeota bacterium]
MNIFTRCTSLTLAIAMALATFGCETMNEHRTATGAVIGTLAGAGAGAAIDSHNRGRGALIGGAAGAALGTGVGYMLDKQKEQFDRIKDLETRQVTLEQQQAQLAAGQQAAPQQVQALQLRIGSEILFQKDSAALTPYGTSKIQEIAQVLNEYPDSQVIVKGFTSSEGQDAYNVQLSQRRADVVRNTLVAYGVNAARVQALGMGESNPIASNETEAGRVQNRRVEIDVIPRS